MDIVSYFKFFSKNPAGRCGEKLDPFQTDSENQHKRGNDAPKRPDNFGLFLDIVHIMHPKSNRKEPKIAEDENEQRGIRVPKCPIPRYP